MSEITLTINGKQVKGKEGDTVLEVCQINGIDVPSLCHLNGLTDVGACRLCVVEIEKERRPVPSCTYPARDGLVVKTNTEELEKYRRQMLELIFTERNHFCMFCEQSGDCELQKLAYRYQMDHVRYPYLCPSLPVDAISEYLVVDHNRCVLCGRCIRACDEIAASRTLDFSQHGWKTMVSADLEQPLGESSCLSCGACVQACPTGAIFNKLGIYKGRTDECEQVMAVCPACAVGCELNVLVKDNNIVKIEAPDLTASRGALCRMGRFDLLKQTPPRITSPMMRNSEGKLEGCTIDKAVKVIVEKMVEANGDFAGIVSTRLPSETITSFHKLFQEVLGNNLIDTLDGKISRTIIQGIEQFEGKGRGLGIECYIEEILMADCIMVVEGDPEKTNPIIGTFIRKAIKQRSAKLIVIDPSRTAFPLRTDLWLKPNAGSEKYLLNGLVKILVDRGLVTTGKTSTGFIQGLDQYQIDEVVKVTGIDKERLEEVAEIYSNAEHGVIIYGEDLLLGGEPELVTSLLTLADITGNYIGDKLRVISLKPNANSWGAWELGLAKGIESKTIKGLYLLLGDDNINMNEELSSWLKGIGALIVQASYQSPVTAIADLVVPSPIWAERGGTYVSMDGHTLKSKQVLQTGDGLLQDKEILMKLALELGHELS